MPQRDYKICHFHKFMRFLFFYTISSLVYKINMKEINSTFTVIAPIFRRLPEKCECEKKKDEDEIDENERMQESNKNQNQKK